MSTTPNGRGTILVVEDDEDSRYVYGVVLEGHGFSVAMARTGDEGLRLARETKPLAILMDVSIPVMDGWTATAHLKADPETEHIPVIIITAHAFPEDLTRAEQVGCDGFLTKPCEPTRVLAEVVRLVGSP
ncbi:MAG: response regulator [Gemmatimonadales bacterium]